MCEPHATMNEFHKAMTIAMQPGGAEEDGDGEEPESGE